MISSVLLALAQAAAPAPAATPLDRASHEWAGCVKDRLDAEMQSSKSADTLIKIKGEDAAFLREAPHTLPRSRPDEVKAAKEPVLRWRG